MKAAGGFGNGKNFSRGDEMKKNNLKPGRKYLHRRQTVIDGVLREAERWIKCERITPTGAIFSRDFEPETVLSDEQIEKELTEGWEK